ncbi:putative lipid II flippase FtsW [Euzebya sp.]|uniref:putative lipid II flippase FtsW n=1 Tax=Euzebya sp. TaxID=1971409 RepID=UPI0035117401
MAITRATSTTAPSRRLVLAGRATTDAIGLAVVGGGLLVLGLVMTFSASFVQSAAQTGDAFDVFARQAFWAGIGLPVALVAAAVDYRRWRRGTALALLVTLVAMVLVLIVGEEINGARRWFQLGPLSVQPAEIVKLTLPAYTAHILALRWARVRRGDVTAMWLPAGPAIVLAAALVAVSPDLESAVLVAAVGLTPLFVAGLPLRILAIGGAVVAGLAAWAISTTPYRVGRIDAWLDPTNEAFRDGYGYQTTQGFIALGNGGVLGVGLGQGRGKWLYVPNAHTDFIYAIIGEELGLIGALCVMAAFAALAFFGCRTAMRAPDTFGRLLAAGITAWLALQAAINISSVVGVLPVTGVTLPLVSFGGSSLVITMAGVGILIAVARQCPPVGTRAGQGGAEGVDVEVADDDG